MRICQLAVALAISFAITSCVGERAAAAGGSAGLATSFDSTRADTVEARTIGAVPLRAMRSVHEELRLAPTADDTSLFGDVSEFDVGLDGRLFVFDRTASTLFLFDPTGALLRRVGRRGAGPGEFNGNNGMVVMRDGSLAQWDSRNARISFFSADGALIKSWLVPSTFSTGDGLRTDRAGALYMYRPVTEPRDDEILGRFGLVRINEGGAYGDSLEPPDLPVRLQTYEAQSKGGRSSSTAQYGNRFLWAWHPEGYFVSVATDRYVLESSRPGRALRIVRDAPVIEVPAADREAEQAMITRGMRMTDPGWTWRGPELPSTKPAVAALQIARDGRIWVRVATPSELIPEAEREPPTPNAPPPSVYRESTAYEVFAIDGRFIGRVGFPTAAQLVEADGDLVWYLVRDSDGLPAVVRARVQPAFP